MESCEGMIGWMPLKQGPREFSHPFFYSTRIKWEDGPLLGRQFTPEPEDAGTLISDLKPPEL